MSVPLFFAFSFLPSFELDEVGWQGRVGAVVMYLLVRLKKKWMHWSSISPLKKKKKGKENSRKAMGGRKT